MSFSIFLMLNLLAFLPVITQADGNLSGSDALINTVLYFILVPSLLITVVVGIVLFIIEFCRHKALPRKKIKNIGNQLLFIFLFLSLVIYILLTIYF